MNTDDALLLHAKYYKDIIMEAEELYKRGDNDLLAGLQLIDLEWANIQLGQKHAAALREVSCAAARLTSDYIAPLVLTIRQHPQERIQWLENAVEAGGYGCD